MNEILPIESKWNTAERMAKMEQRQDELEATAGKILYQLKALMDALVAGKIIKLGDPDATPND